MSFKLDAYVLNQKKGGGSWVVDELHSIGVWEGQELKNSGDCPDGTFTGVTSQFENTTKAKPDKPKPLTFSWKPTSKEKTLFQSSLKNAQFHMRVGVQKNGTENRWTLSFNQVKIIKISKKQNIERIDASYVDFNYTSS
ncbi:MAG: hypothetical protein AB1757_21610 [Acidobacteriota bacterium]